MNYDIVMIVAVNIDAGNNKIKNKVCLDSLFR